MRTKSQWLKGFLAGIGATFGFAYFMEVTGANETYLHHKATRPRNKV